MKRLKSWEFFTSVIQWNILQITPVNFKEFQSLCRISELSSKVYTDCARWSWYAEIIVVELTYQIFFFSLFVHFSRSKNCEVFPSFISLQPFSRTSSSLWIFTRTNKCSISRIPLTTCRGIIVFLRPWSHPHPKYNH